MTVEIIQGNLWATKAQVVVNTVNCEGVMGAGVALEAGLRFPDMLERYKAYCRSGAIDIGKLWIYKNSHPYWVLNFPTKISWRNPSKMEYLERGLQKFVDTYQQRQIESIAYPLLGASNGGLNQEDVIKVMRSYLDNIDIPVEIYIHDTGAFDDRLKRFQGLLVEADIQALSDQSGLSVKQLQLLGDAMAKDPSLRQIMQLKRVKGIGNDALSKIFRCTTSDNVIGATLLS